MSKSFTPGRIVAFAWIPMTGVLAYFYAEIWHTQNGLWQDRPYVYRQFVPLAVRLLVWLTGMDIHQAIILVVVLCALGFAWAAHDLYRLFHAA